MISLYSNLRSVWPITNIVRTHGTWIVRRKIRDGGACKTDIPRPRTSELSYLELGDVFIAEIQPYGHGFTCNIECRDRARVQAKKSWFLEPILMILFVGSLLRILVLLTVLVGARFSNDLRHYFNVCSFIVYNYYFFSKEVGSYLLVPTNEFSVWPAFPPVIWP